MKGDAPIQWAVTGPTASGKTELALALAKKAGRPLVNTDVFQFYREIPIISNQPKLSEEWSHLAFCSLNDEVSCRKFSASTQKLLQAPHIFVGSGLYLLGALHGFDSDLRKGTPFYSEAKASFRMIVLSPPRATLYDKINQRVDEMIERGALDEAEKIFKQIQSNEISLSAPGLKAIGLKHLLQYWAKEMSLEDCVALWKQDTRRLAKRQWTWLRKFCPPSANCIWRDKPKPEEAIYAFLQAGDMDEAFQQQNEKIFEASIQKRLGSSR